MAPKPTAMPKDFRFVFGVLFFVSLNGAAGSTMMQSLLPAIGRSTGIADNLIVTISSLSALCALVATPYWGRRADVIGRKRVIQIGIVGVIACMAATGAAVLAGVHQLYAPAVVLTSLILARSLYGVIGMASSPAIQSYVGVNTNREQRTNAMALLASAMGIGTIVGPAVAPFLILPVVGLGGPFFFFAMLGVVALVVATLYVPADSPVKAAGPAAPQPRVTVWRNPAVIPFIAYAMVLGFAMANNFQTLGFVVIDRLKLAPIAAQPFAGAAMMAGAMAMLVAQWGLIRLLRLTPAQLLLWGAVCVLVGNIMQAFAPTYAAIVIAFSLINVGFGFGRPGFTAGVSLAVPSEQQGAVAGALGSVMATGLIFGPILALTLYGWSRPSPFLLNAVLMAALVVYCRLSPSLRNAGAHHPVSEELVEASVLDERS